MFKKKKLEHKCKNCGLFDKAQEICRVIVLVEGERINVPVDSEDDCFYEGTFTAIDVDGKKEEFNVPVENVKFWVEDEEGNQVDGDGIVKIEYPEGFFGEESPPLQ